MTNRKKKEVVLSESTEDIEIDSPEVENFEDFFNYAGEGYSIVINREEPVELKGFLEEIPLDENIFNLEYLAKTWGGKQFRIMLRSPSGKFKSRRIINMRSYPPLMRGRKIVDENDMLFGSVTRKLEQRQDNGDHILKAAQVLKSLTPETPIQPVNNGNDSMLEILKILLTTQMQQMSNMQSSIQSSSPQNNMAEFMGFMAKTRDFWKNPDEERKNSGNDETQMLGSVLDLAKTVLSQPKDVQRNHPPRLVAPNPVQKPAQKPIQVQNSVKSKSISESEDEIEQKVHDFISSLSAVDATKLYLMKFQNCPPEQQEIALEMVCQALGIEVEDIEDELPDNTSEMSGRELSTDEDDTPGNRSLDKKIS